MPDNINLLMSSAGIPAEPANASEDLFTKQLQESFNPTPIYVYNNKLTIIIWGNPNYAIIIENQNLADAYRKQFNLLWKISKRTAAHPH